MLLWLANLNNAGGEGDGVVTPPAPPFRHIYRRRNNRIRARRAA
jgi:hypothetical protein